MEMNLTKVVYSKQTDTLLKVVSIVGGLVVLVSAYSFYLNNFWKPKIKILEVDYDKGFAKVQSNGKTYELFGDDVVAIKAGWGVKVGHENRRLELVKNGQVVDYLT